jgi:hypothetical protein
MRVYVVLFAGFIAAFGAARWDLPMSLHKDGAQSPPGVDPRPELADDARTGRTQEAVSGAPSVRSWAFAAALLAVLVGTWLIIVVLT